MPGGTAPLPIEGTYRISFLLPVLIIFLTARLILAGRLDEQYAPADILAFHLAWLFILLARVS